ncbi:MAG: alpha/beta hydrolase [Acidimicrobiia bacterium]|nr:MAG: alpha/beta hydrolase [Acidimicrobiia bacterium]
MADAPAGGSAPGAPPVLLVHGFASSFEHGWRDPGWVDILADAGREVIGVDLLGHGGAPKPRDPAAYTDGLADSVRAVLPPDGRPVDGVGFSLGAVQLLRLAAQDPSRFSRLVLIGVGGATFAARDAADAGVAPPPGRVFDQLMDAPRNDRAALEACLRRPHAPFGPDDLGRVTVPCAVIVSDRDELAGDPRPLVEALPDARCTVLRGVDHFQTPREFACIDAALAFLGV